MIVGLISGILSPQKFWHQIKTGKNRLSHIEHQAVTWAVRSVVILAVISGIVVLLVNSPSSDSLPISITGCDED